MKVVGLVAVRMKSSRLKKKALLDLNGQPLIVNLLRRLKGAKRLDDIVVCTSVNPDDRVLLEIAQQQGFKSFAGSEDDVMERFLEAGKREHADVIIRITGDNPLTDPGIIDAMVESHLKTGADYTRMDNLPAGVTAEVITLAALQKAYDLAVNSSYSEYMTYYFVNYPKIFRLNIMAADRSVSRPGYRLTVDYPEDYDVMNKIFTHFKNTPAVSLPNVIQFLDEHPEIVQVNADKKPAPLDPDINTELNVPLVN